MCSSAVLCRMVSVVLIGRAINLHHTLSVLERTFVVPDKKALSTGGVESLSITVC